MLDPVSFSLVQNFKSNMASEIDPILVRALNLLHSKHPKALEQLCALRDEALGKKPESIPEVSGQISQIMRRSQ